MVLEWRVGDATTTSNSRKRETTTTRKNPATTRKNRGTTTTIENRDDYRRLTRNAKRARVLTVGDGRSGRRLADWRKRLR